MWDFSQQLQQRKKTSYDADACIERYGLKTVRYEAQVKHPHMPVRRWKHSPMITVCMTQNHCGILEGFILHIMPRRWRVKVRKKGQGVGTYRGRIRSQGRRL